MKPNALHRVHVLMLSLLSVMILGCAPLFPRPPPPPVVVPAPEIPALSQSARQPALPPDLCNPTCSASLMIAREDWRKRLTTPSSPAAAASASTAR